MTSQSRRQTRSRQFGPDAALRDPVLHNRLVKIRKEHARITKSFRQIAWAAERAAHAMRVAIGTDFGGFVTALVIEDIVAEACSLGMDVDDARQSIEDYREMNPSATWAATRQAVGDAAMRSALLGSDR